MLYFEVMMRRVTLIVILVAVPFLFLLGYYFHSDVRGELIDPFIGSEAVPYTPNILPGILSDVPVACVLEHGTFQISQQECDEMLEHQNNQDPDSTYTACEIAEATFLVSERECEILRNSQGSSDVIKRIDQ